MKSIEHLHTQTLRKHGLSAEEGKKTFTKFHEAVGGMTDERWAYRTRAAEQTGSWLAPSNEIEKDFALDAIISVLVEV